MALKYSLNIDIALPRDRVIELFDSTENLYKWQPELKSFDHVSGEPGQVGAVSKLVVAMGKREIEMTETITVRNFPHEFSGIYETKGVRNPMQNLFEEIDSNNTKWITTTEFHCSGITKIMCFIMPGAFKKQTFQFMENFKKFAEAEGTK